MLEEVLKQILDKMGNMEAKMGNMEAKMDKIESRMDKMEIGIFDIKDQIKMNDRVYREEFRQLNKKNDVVTDAVVKTIESINALEVKIEKQDVEITVIKGGESGRKCRAK